MRNLVVVRAGDNSLHESWLGADRRWDLIVSYYGDDPERFRRDDVLRMDSKGGKFEGLYAVFATRPDLLQNYDYIWLPDDDLATDCATISRLFSVMAEYRLALAQPGLSPDSYFYFPELIRNPEFVLRFTTYVEVMMPCFEVKFLRRIVHLFASLRFGWNLDTFWARMIADPKYRSAIIDACEVLHTRPLGTGALYKVGDPKEEKERIVRAFPPTHSMRHMVYGGVTKEGARLERGPTFAWRSAKGIWEAFSRINETWAGRDKKFRSRVLKAHLKYRSDLSEVPVPADIP